MTATLLNSYDPMRLFRASFDEHITKPLLAARGQLQKEHEQRERELIVTAQCRREHCMPSL